MKRIEIEPIEANSWHLFSEVLERLYDAPQLIQSVPNKTENDLLARCDARAPKD
jgi:hypothetical protein